ncbi:MAG: hypothetical protein O9294_16790 [Cytophagales bacterium]|jgi:hypothetical protein|nr:hypothetical protein [Cytophagales bacterium]
MNHTLFKFTAYYSRGILSSLLLCLLLTIGGHAQHTTFDRPSVHGMVVFGKHTVYASHLPMFHAPHNYQVILELELNPKDKANFILDQEKYPENNTYTLAPERFILPEILDNLKTFNALLYRGHFERGGMPIIDSIRITIKRILFFDTLSIPNITTQNRYLLIGNASEQYAIHRISNAPDFDQIIQVRCSEKNYPITLNTALTKSQLPNISGNWEILTETVSNRPIRLQWLRQLYLEFSDLIEDSH